MLPYARNPFACRLPAIAFALLVGGPSTASAQAPPEFLRCANRDLDPDARIAACNQILNSGRSLSPRNLAATHINRGGAYGKKGDYGRAAAD
ncbi:unnamed protein product, partial [Phaeothamnion confervicola]